MGKSEVVPMPIHRQDSLLAGCNGTYNKVPIHTVDESGEDEDKEDFGIPENMEIFAHQVAGHTNDGKSFGMIKHAGTVLKPITNPISGEREMKFYEELEHNTTTDDLIELKKFVPKFFGNVTIPIKEKPVDCIVLEDLTKYYKEPCVLDVKIGRRTWDPTATSNKIKKEEAKYQDCKRDLAFCIPGFQVYDIYTNQLRKFDKEYGKKLDKNSVPQALKIFLNGNPTVCRSLIVQFLASLWEIQMWARRQHHLRLYSSSLLFVYDARRLRECLKTDSATVRSPIKLHRSTSLYRPLSLAVLNNEKISTGFSGQLTTEGPILKTTRSKVKEFDIVGLNSRNNVWQKSIRILKRTHSFQNDYDKDMQNKKQNYTYILDELCMEQKSEVWASVKMIDFAHAFPGEYHDVDKNYLDGIDNLVRVFEEFLVESE